KNLLNEPLSDHSDFGVYFITLTSKQSKFKEAKYVSFINFRVSEKQFFCFHFLKSEGKSFIEPMSSSKEDASKEL
ncbi:hypothetical protein, partial [Shewanella benthica]|uniref:hypothetical protein n=1 Tax=Shewanella benthica TaxID=43661 RepID=UPI00058ECF80